MENQPYDRLTRTRRPVGGLRRTLKPSFTSYNISKGLWSDLGKTLRPILRTASAGRYSPCSKISWMTYCPTAPLPKSRSTSVVYTSWEELGVRSKNHIGVLVNDTSANSACLAYLAPITKLRGSGRATRDDILKHQGLAASPAPGNDPSHATRHLFTHGPICRGTEVCSSISALNSWPTRLLRLCFSLGLDHL